MAVDIRDTRNAVGPDTTFPPPTQPPLTPPQQEVKTSAEAVSVGSIGEVAGGIGALVLAIVGLAGLDARWLAPIAVIVLGGAILMHGFAVAARFYQLLDETGRTTGEEVEMGSGTGAEILGGTAGIVLGILGLLGIYPTILTAVAVIVFGGTLLLGCGTNARLNAARYRNAFGQPRDIAARVASDIVMAANGIQALVALAAIILGIISLCLVYYSMVVALVAILCVAASQLLSGGALTGRMMTLINRR